MQDKKDLKEPPVYILAIESSCDETAAAVVQDGRSVLSSVVFSQIPLHVPYGGVVPEIASRSHVEKVDWVVTQAMQEAGLAFADLSAIAVTQGPGLVGALLVGVSYAKGLAYALNKPLLAVNHILGHISANELAHPDLAPPFLCLVASGGHSHLIAITKEGNKLLGCTQDDAAGEAFDKAARVLGLSYPGGPNLDRLADAGDDTRYALPHPHPQGSYDYSFSGLKTAFLNLVNNMKQKNEPFQPEDLAACFRKAVVDHLTQKALRACLDHGFTDLALAGGVSANRLLRQSLGELCEANNIRLFLPPLSLCGDNAAMIGAAAFHLYKQGLFAPLDLNADPSLRLSFLTEG